MFPAELVLLFSLVAGLLSGGALYAWSWSRQRRRFAFGGAAAALGFLAWNLTLNATNATGFNVDAPVIPLSWADAGSGVMAFAATALVLGLIAERGEPAGRVVGAAAIAGLVAMLLDLFVL